MKYVLKFIATAAALLLIARAILVGIDFLYKKYGGNHYIEASDN